MDSTKDHLEIRDEKNDSQFSRDDNFNVDTLSHNSLKKEEWFDHKILTPDQNIDYNLEAIFNYFSKSSTTGSNVSKLFSDI